MAIETGDTQVCQAEAEPYVVVYDLETQSKISDMPGQTREDQVAALQMSVACVICVPSRLVIDPLRAEDAINEARVHIIWRDELYDGNQPVEAILKLFDGAELIAGFNVCSFDSLVLRKHYAGNADRYYAHLEKTFDPFSRLRDSTQTWYKLDHLLKANGLETKTADGLEAIKMWANNERSRLAEYCKVDTLQTLRMMLLPTLTLPKKGVNNPSSVGNHVFGLSSAIAALRAARGL